MGGVLAHADAQYRPALAFLAGTGCRLGEALGLTGALVAALREHRLASADTSDDALVFVSGLGAPLDHRNVARRGLVGACKRAGQVVVSPHALRHAHASALLADGWDLPAVSRRPGHGSVAITASTYAHLLDDDARRAQRREALDATYGADTAPQGSAGAAADRGRPRTTPARRSRPARAKVAGFQAVRARAAS